MIIKKNKHVNATEIFVGNKIFESSRTDGKILPYSLLIKYFTLLIKSIALGTSHYSTRETAVSQGGVWL